MTETIIACVIAFVILALSIFVMFYGVYDLIKSIKNKGWAWVKENLLIVLGSTLGLVVVYGLFLIGKWAIDTCLETLCGGF